MSLWSKLFARAPAEAPAPPSTEDVLAEVRAGHAVDWEAVHDGLDADAAFALLWQALPLARADRRVDVIDQLAAYDLDAAEQRTLLAAALELGDLLAWAARSVADACDLPGFLARAQAEADDATLAGVARVLAALVEAALTTGPAGDLLDVEDGAVCLRAFADATTARGATTAELALLLMSRQLCASPRIGPDDRAAGWDDALATALEAAILAVLSRPPRGADALWTAYLPERVGSAPAFAALEALRVARAVRIDVSFALAERLRAAPDDAGTWSVALAALDLPAVRDVALDAGVAALQSRRMREGELCSLASQAGCSSCGGPKGADDDELMVPKALEARLLPLLAACAAAPGAFATFVVECLAAPSIALRFNALAVLSHWPTEAIEAETWSVLDALRDDSVPQVRAAVLELLGRRPS